MKVYTKTGDEGMTSLVDGTRVSKCDERVEAYGTVDELVAFTALLRDELRGEELPGDDYYTVSGTVVDIVAQLGRVECTLMTLSALLAAGESGRERLPQLKDEDTIFLEQRIDAMQEEVGMVSDFTIAGGCREVSLCHVCRTVCRRAERAALRADARYGVDKAALVWLNRLSDYFYLLGRLLTKHFGIEEEYWRP